MSGIERSKQVVKSTALVPGVYGAHRMIARHDFILRRSS